MGKFLFAAVCALFMLLAGCSLNDYSPGPGVTITPTTLTPVTTPTATATVTVTAPPRPMWPTETFKTKNPATAQGCIDNGLNADDWDTVDDFGSGAMSDGRYSLPDPVGFETLRELRNVPDYEGYSSFGIGVDHKVPFAVEYEIGGSSGTGKVIVYLAHE
jgi:hypothetical protein